MYKKVLIGIVIVLLVCGNIYFYNQSQKLDYRIMMGVPVTGQGDYPSTGINFYDEPLSDRDDANLLILSFMDGVSVDKPKVCEKLPNLTVVFNDWKKNISYYQVNLWIDGDKVIIGTNTHESKYKIIDSSQAIELKKIIERYPTKTYK